MILQLNRLTKCSKFSDLKKNKFENHYFINLKSVSSHADRHERKNALEKITILIPRINKKMLKKKETQQNLIPLFISTQRVLEFKAINSLAN